MILRRTANAGVLLELDDVSVLLDGVCHRVDPYLETPAPLLQELLDNPPDLLAFTHEHEDHFHAGFASAYKKKTLRPILGPESLPLRGVQHQGIQVGDLQIQPVESRHIGKNTNLTQHRSYLIRGSKTIFFLGDASPLQWKNWRITLKPDVIMVPFAYATNETGWEMVRRLQPETVVVLHMPLESNDPVGLWPMVRGTTVGEQKIRILIPQMGEAFEL